MPKNATSSQHDSHVQSYRGIAIAAVVLSIVSLLPSLYMNVIRLINYVSPKLLDIDTQGAYTLLIIVIISMVTVVPISGVISLIFSIIVIKKKSPAYRIAVAALILLAVGFILNAVFLPSFLAPFH